MKQVHCHNYQEHIVLSPQRYPEGIARLRPSVWIASCALYTNTLGERVLASMASIFSYLWRGERKLVNNANGCSPFWQRNGAMKRVLLKKKYQFSHLFHLRVRRECSKYDILQTWLGLHTYTEAPFIKARGHVGGTTNSLACCLQTYLAQCILWNMRVTTAVPAPEWTLGSLLLLNSWSFVGRGRKTVT
jgi:hypothetical protein